MYFPSVRVEYARVFSQHFISLTSFAQHVSCHTELIFLPCTQSGGLISSSVYEDAFENDTASSVSSMMTSRSAANTNHNNTKKNNNNYNGGSSSKPAPSVVSTASVSSRKSAAQDLVDAGLYDTPNDDIQIKRRGTLNAERKRNDAVEQPFGGVPARPKNSNEKEQIILQKRQVCLE